MIDGATLCSDWYHALDLTDVLIAFLDGLGLQALIYPELFPADRQLELLDLQLSRLGLKNVDTHQLMEG